MVASLRSLSRSSRVRTATSVRSQLATASAESSRPTVAASTHSSEVGSGAAGLPACQRRSVLKYTEFGSSRQLARWRSMASSAGCWRPGMAA